MKVIFLALVPLITLLVVLIAVGVLSVDVFMLTPFANVSILVQWLL